MDFATDRTSDFVNSVNQFRLKSGLNPQSMLTNGLESVSTQCANHVFPELQSENLNLSHFDDESNINVSISLRKLNRSKILHQRSEFMKTAALIGSDLTNTFGKLEKLHDLTKKQTLFDDHGVEIQNLTYNVKESMANLYSRIANLQKLSIQVLNDLQMIYCDFNLNIGFCKGNWSHFLFA